VNECREKDSDAMHQNRREGTTITSKISPIGFVLFARFYLLMLFARSIDSACIQRGRERSVCITRRRNDPQHV
jgi:hypothetical protein